ncbi:MAG: hypothetical protein ACOX4M_10660 [Acetivibrionales bacterium]|jgi:hypothetical protein
MKKTVHRSMALLLFIILVLTVSSCAKNNEDVFLPGESSGITGKAAQEAAPDPQGAEASGVSGETSGADGLTGLSEANNSADRSRIEKLKSVEKAFLASDFYRDKQMMPLTVTDDQKYFIAYRVSDESLEKENELILVGMPRQTVDLYLVDLAGNKAERVGKTGFIISHAWSGDGKLLSLVSHKSVAVLDVAAGRLKEVPAEYETERIYNTNWEPDNRTLNIHLDTVANYYSFDSVSGKMLKARGGFAEGDVVYRGTAGDKVLFSKGESVGVAEGLFIKAGKEEAKKQLFTGNVVIHDIYQGRILVCREQADYRYTLEDYDTRTGDSRIIYGRGNNQDAGKVFKASYLKTTGDVIYTTFDLDENGVKYYLVRIGPDGKKSETRVPSPLYTVTPGESTLHFAVFKGTDPCFMDTGSFQFSGGSENREFENKEIRDLMYRVLDIYSSDKPDIAKIRQVFINSYDGIPQEALENILLELENPAYWEYVKPEIGKDVTMKVSYSDNGNSASVALNFFFRGPHELVKKEGKWYVTGFSTWPGSKDRNDVYKACKQYIDKEIKAGKAVDAVITDFSKIDVGEIELWAMSDPHRAVFPDAYASEARVKIIVSRHDGSAEKFMAHFSRRDTGKRWEFKSLGKLSPSLFPGK